MQQGYESYVGGAAEGQYSNDKPTQDTKPMASSAETDAVKVEVTSVMDDLNENDRETMCKIFVGNIPRHVMDEEFKTFFEDKVPSIKDVFVMKDMQNPGNNRGFAFLSLATIEDVDALLMGPKLSFGGRPLDIKRASPKDCEDPLLHIKTNRIFLGGLTPAITEDEISDYYEKRFPPTGRPIEVIIKKDRNTDKPRGFCFVVFQNEHVVDKIMLLERKPTILGKRLDVRKADASGMNPNAGRRGPNMHAAGMGGYGPMGGMGNRRGRQMMNMPFNAGMRGRGGYMPSRGGYGGPMGAGAAGGMPMMQQQHQQQQQQYQPYYNRNQYGGAQSQMGDPSSAMSMGGYSAPQQGMQGGHESMYSSYMQQSASAAAAAAGQMSSVTNSNQVAPGTAYHQSAAAAGMSQSAYPGSAVGAPPQQGGLPNRRGMNTRGGPNNTRGGMTTNVAGMNGAMGGASYAQFMYQRAKQGQQQQPPPSGY